THLLGKQGRHYVGLILVGDRDEDIDLINVFLGQQLLIRCITTEDDGVLQLFRELFGPLLVALYELDAVALLQLTGETGTYVATPDYHDAAIRALEPLQLR